MKLMARTVFVSVLSLLVAHAQERPAVEPLHFHHVHLNSLNPAAAAEDYPKPFAASATRTTFNGFEAVKTGNVYILFTKVAIAAPERAERTADVGVAFRLEHAGLAQVQRAVPRDGA